MTDQHYQTKVAKFIRQHDLETDVNIRLIDLLSELGELAKEALKSSHYGERPFIHNNAWEEELGDVFFSLICLAYSTDVSLDEALDHVLDKYKRRMGKKGHIGSE